MLERSGPVIDNSKEVFEFYAVVLGFKKLMYVQIGKSCKSGLITRPERKTTLIPKTNENSKADTLKKLIHYKGVVFLTIIVFV